MMSIPGFFVITNAGYISFWGEEDPSRNRADWNEAHALEDALIDWMDRPQDRGEEED